MTGYPKISFGIIVLNGEPFTKYCLRSLYPFAYEIIVVEGACQKAACIATVEGHSYDRTMKSLHEFKEQEDTENKVKIITKDGFWRGKDEQSQAYAEVATGDYLWQVDIDEFYMPEDMEFIVKMFKNIPEITAVSFELITFWGDICYRCNTTYPLLNPVQPIHRIFKFGKDYRYVNHRPPTVVDPQGIDLRAKKWVPGSLMASKGIYFYHYSLLFPKQVQDKVNYYSNLPYDHCPSMPEWAKRNYHRISNPFNVFNVHTYPGWLERYNGKHPPQIYKMVEDIRDKKINIEIRSNLDVEEFIDNTTYHRGINLIKQEYAKRSNKIIKNTDPIFNDNLFQEFKRDFSQQSKPNNNPATVSQPNDFRKGGIGSNIFNDEDLFVKPNSRKDVQTSSGNPMVLLYSRVADDPVDSQLLAVSPQNFESHLKELAENYRVVPLAKLLDEVRQNRFIPNTVAITFDDGYADNLTSALPLLKKYGLHATIFVTSGMVGSDREFWWDALERIFVTCPNLPSDLKVAYSGGTFDLGLTTPEERLKAMDELAAFLKEQPYEEIAPFIDNLYGWAGLTTKQARPSHLIANNVQLNQLAASPSIEIGSHTITHTRLSSLSRQKQRYEIRHSRQQLENIIKKPVRILSYPFGTRGDYTDETMRILAEEGFDAGISNIQGSIELPIDLYSVPRRLVRNWPRQQFEAWLSNSGNSQLEAGTVAARPDKIMANMTVSAC